jgi:hypothetical protein
MVEGELHRSNEAIASAMQRRDEARIVRRVAQRLTDLADPRVEAVIEAYEGVSGPQLPLEFLSPYYSARPLQQHGQDLEGLFLKPYPQAALAELSRSEVKLENSGADQA